MTVISRKNHAMFFNGITDSIVVPEGSFSSLGTKTTQGTPDVRPIISEDSPLSYRGSSATSGSFSGYMTVEAWVMPDCGGTIIEKEGQFELTLGNIDTPGPATFTVTLAGENGETQVTLTTANFSSNRYEGMVYPHIEYQGVQDSYNRFVSGRDDATDLNKNHRPLIHVVGAVRPSSVELYVNGELVAAESTKNKNLILAESSKQTYIGGKGGKFRGTMEAIHINGNFKSAMINNNCPLPDADTLLLYRFEEPISPIEGVYTFSSIANSSLTLDGSSITLSQITVSTTDAVKLAKQLTGLETVSGHYVFSKDTATEAGGLHTGVHKYSSGDYKVLDYQSGSLSTHAISHTPYNLLINPNGIDPDTKAPNGKPPERVRLHNINTATGTILVSSIHLDFASSTNGMLPALHTRSAGVDNHFVVVSSDLLLDTATGNPYQPPHYTSQIVDRTGQMVIDESEFGNHGFVYSSAMATTTSDTNNPFAATWPTTVDAAYQIGHSGRHTENHVEGHSYLRILPKASAELIDQRADGSADVVDIIYDEMQSGIDKVVPINSVLDLYREFGAVEIKDVVSSSTVTAAYNSYNGTTSPPAGKRKLIAIGGPNFDYTPFALKGPIPPFQKHDPDDAQTHISSDIRKYHVKPSKESRVAILHVPRLSDLTPTLAPFVEIHYNAIDLTGESVSKTFSDSTCDYNNDPTITIDSTAFLIPGMAVSGNGIPTGATVSSITNGTTFELSVSTNSGSFSNSTLTFTTVTQPLLMVEKTVPSSDTLVSGAEYIYDSIIHAISSGMTLHAPGGYIDVSSQDINTNDAILYDHSLVGDTSEGYSSDDEIDESLTPANYTPRNNSDSIQNQTPGVILDSTSTTGTHDSVFHKLYLEKVNKDKAITDKGSYRRVDPDLAVGSPSAGQFDTGTVSSATPIHEVFDIVDNYLLTSGSDNDMRIIVQPCDRKRSGLLSKVNISSTPNQAALLYMMSRVKVRSIEESVPGEGAVETINCIGIGDSIVSRAMNFSGRGSPDSHIVKEIEPNAPVVTVTLGGPGQGAIDTRPVFQKSMLAHESYSTRRSYAVTATKVNMNWTSGAGTMHVKPLNNESTDLASWGTYGFPKIGRVYLSDGSSAKYDSKTGSTFVFSVATEGDGDFLAADGTEYTTIGSLLRGVANMIGVNVGTNEDVVGNFTVFNEPDFGDQSNLENGTTVNDRMHQALSDVQHDYQLGTQYASTRAIAEIPFFSKQFFDPSVGPDNSFKIHVDATHTAHTYNPSPVGRRFTDEPPSDREVQSAYSVALANREYINSTFITKYDSTNQRLHVNDISIFPAATTALAPYKGVREAYRYRKVWLANGEWGWYSNNLAAGYLTLLTTTYGHSDNFLTSLAPGIAVFVGGPVFDDTGKPLASDDFTPSSDFEDRSEYYHDAASVKTQGGNVDYGLRQYVSAVEFKAGPESNPHAARIQTKRATGKVLTSTFVTLGSNDKAVIVTLDKSDFIKFPNLGYDTLEDAPSSVGDLGYEVQYDDDGTIYTYQYHGSLKRITEGAFNVDLDIPENSVVLVYQTSGTSYPSDLDGFTITLARRCRSILGTAVTAEVLDGSQYFRELKNSLNIADVTITANGSTSSTITIDGASGKNVNDLHGINVKTGDTLYYLEDTTTDAIRKIGVVSEVGGSDANGTQTVTLTATGPIIPSNAKLAVWMGDYEDEDAILNATWLNPYAPGGLRNGDTIWSNMSYNNPHAVEGMFAKSRGVYNEAEVWSEFNGGSGVLDSTNPRDSIPIENFLIGNTCLETARNYAQHVNRTIEENYLALGLTVSQAPTVAFVDPYLSDEGHARVLLYDVAHDREFIAFQDIHMQVQSSAQAVQIGWPKEVVESGSARTEVHQVNAVYNGAGPSPWTTQIDVTNGYLSQNPYVRSTQQSKFIESAYAHDLANRQTEDLLDSGTFDEQTVDLPTDGRTLAGSRIYGKAHGHHVHTGYSYGGALSGLRDGYSLTPRTRDAVTLHKVADPFHPFTRLQLDSTDTFTKALVKLRDGTDGCTFRDSSTLFDTPDGTRVIPAYLCLKGVRSTSLDLSSHEETRLQHLPQWKDMDFVRRLTIDTGEVAERDGVTSTLAAAEEIVRLINQHAALNARLLTGSAHDPAPFWHIDNGDRGAHMGYIRAHIGREVQDLNGDTGYTVVIHSTVPGASGRNFCVWLDNSKGQSIYQPQFLVGHGGRWRNFWALPDEREGENMHPAPMPLDKNGRPFAPITTLQQYITASDSGEDVASVADYEDSAVMRAVSDSISGKGHNTVNTESLDVKGSSSSLVKGLRVGKRAMSRVNFGGLVASGVPGWAPDAGNWGFGKTGEGKFDKRYGSSAQTVYSSHVPVGDTTPDAVGKGQLFGFRFKSNTGTESGLRYIYRSLGTPFANENTVLPPTIEDEVCIFFDDRDVGQGGFTIGGHMSGSGDATGRIADRGSVSRTDKSWRGARWRGVSAPDVAVHASASISGTTLTVTFDKDPFEHTDNALKDDTVSVSSTYTTSNNFVTVDTTGLEVGMGVSGTGIPAGTTIASITNSQRLLLSATPTSATTSSLTYANLRADMAGYLGFPKRNGILQLTDFAASTNVGQTVSYERRTVIPNASGDHVHKFYGCLNLPGSISETLISPVLNWTTLVTDELIAAATAAAINAGDEVNSEEGHIFDCRDMYATDGRTFGDWGVAENAIRIRAYDPRSPVTPLSSSYTASLRRDHGIHAAHLEFGELITSERTTNGWAFSTSRAVTDANIDASKGIDCGYIPFNLLEVSSRAYGPNANTASPNLVDSSNTPVDITNWREGLKGIQFTRSCGDHILPMIDNPHMLYAGSQASWTTKLTLSNEMYSFLIPAGTTTTNDRPMPTGERKRVWLNDEYFIMAESEQGSDAKTVLKWVVADASGDFPSSTPSDANLIQLHVKQDFDGLRSVGSVFSEPVVYFRGGKSSKDHSVPVFFGGGFSGVVLDVNDGTTNDYSSFYTHPYANGPTGVAGLQNANEISTSFAMLDTNAMFAFFPGAALCNQHRGSITPPAFNKQNILTTDLGRGVTTYSVTGEVKAKPVPIVLRFAHPTARYEDHVDGTDSKTTYLVFGPGQAFPFTNEVAIDSETGTANAKEPFPGRVITSGSTWASVPFKGGHNSLGDNQQLFPNSIENEKHVYRPPSKAYYSGTAAFHWLTTVNWETPAGYCMKGEQAQRPEHGRHYGQQLNYGTPYNAADLTRITPKMHTPMIGFGIATAADTVWHMDGGFHPGGSWLDNQITFNPPHAGKSASRVLSSNWERANQIHPTAFRTSGVLTGRILDYVGNGSEAVATADAKMEYVVVDATRCQNGEELATVLGAAINAFPGAGSLKALGGTHMPSMGNAMRQDRYGWTDLGAMGAYAGGNTDDNLNKYIETAGISTTRAVLEQLPASGWLRTTNDDAIGWACYHSRDVIADSSNFKVRFYLAPNRILGRNAAEDPETWEDFIGNASNDLPAYSTPGNHTIYVWTKAGTIRFNNENVSARDHMTQVHFSGIADAVDRTRPIGAVGWHGERYSYLNSLKITTSITKNGSTTNSTGYAAGLGAYHSMLNFAPYGTAGTVMNTHSNIPVVAPMRGSPESTPTIDGLGHELGFQLTKSNFYTNFNYGTENGDGYANFTLNCNFTDDSTTVTTSSTATLVVGMQLSAAGKAPSGARVASISDATTFVMNADALADGSSISTTFFRYGFHDTDDNTKDANLWATPTNYSTASLPDELARPQGVYSSGFLVVSYESESALIGKYDRDGITANGDWLQLMGQSTDPITFAGTTQWDERFHGQDRFIAPANAGPNVEALIVSNTTAPTASVATNWASSLFTGNLPGTYNHGAISADTSLDNAVPSLNKTGDLLFDLDHSVGSHLLESNDAERNTSADSHTTQHTANWPSNYWMGDVNALQMYEDSAMRNFSVENVVWKRMDGGNLSLPAVNARGLGAVPWMTRVKSNTAYQTGEKLYGNVRFSFETTNSAMMPVLQAQELSHPEFAKKHPYSVGNVMTIPNEEVQFQSINVRDDSGQMHKIEGGSPLGTVIRGFRTPENRGVDGKAPALANSGKMPNMKVRLPDPNSIPGNIVVRSGFDPVQAYQHETIGTGGMQHPDLSASHTGHLFDNSVSSPRISPTYENHNWERIDPVTFDSELGAWNNNEPLQTSYELHDRTLYFHVTKMGHSHSHRFPTVYTHAGGVENDVVSVTAWNSSTSVLTIDATLDTDVFDAGFGTLQDTRKFLRVYNPTTDEGAVCSYTAQGSTSITVVGDVNFATFMAGQTVTNLKVVPSYYIPAGSNRFFASRRLRDHAEVSGNSPDMANTLYFVSGQTVGFDAYSKPVLTPMPFPRMGHHFVTPTMPMLPGHWAHPAYQSLYRRHLIDFGMSKGFIDSEAFASNAGHTDKKSQVDSALDLADNLHALDAEINFSGINAAPSGPSDIHGGAFTLMFESGVRYDGYGVLASTDKGTANGAATTLAGTVNKAGGHSIVLEAASEYTQGRHFPDPAEVGAYQIVIQPNVFNNQLVGYHNNSSTELTSQQINTVIGIKNDDAKGGLTLVLAKATQADVRGCEVFINEKILDISNDPGSQFTNIPPLMLYNHIGAQLTESPAFTRKGFPYSTMFDDATPGHTLHIPWWSILHKNGVQHNGSAVTDATNYRKLSQYSPEDYYMFMRSTFGSVGSQLTINGYTSMYLDIYDEYRKSISLNPKCTVISFNTSGTIVVDNANTFPIYPYYGQQVQYTDKNGIIRTKALNSVDGDTAATVNIPKTLNLAAKSGADSFWDNIFDGAVLTLTHSYNTLPAGDILTNKRQSVFANILPDIIQGNQDTNSRFVPDAFLCMWHHNLGRPNTYFSDNASRNWKGNAVDKAEYNSLPEHYETIHYHDYTHAISTGPFDFLIKRPNVSKTGVVTSGNSTHDAGGTNVMLSGFWPCGSRGGPHASKLDLYGMASASWNVHAIGFADSTCAYNNDPTITMDDTSSLVVGMGVSGTGIPSGATVSSITNSTTFELSASTTGGSITGTLTFTGASANFSSDINLEWMDADDDGSYAVSSGIKATTMGASRRRAYGYRNAVRQAYNKPRYDLFPVRALYEPDASSAAGVNTTDYDAGPLVQTEAYGSGWLYGGGAGDSTVSKATTHVGVMERQTNFTGMLNQDQEGWQVRYSDGRRMTRPFGTPVRTIRNPSGVKRDWWGDTNGKGEVSLSVASQYYLVDWWGNERGEEVRRAPVRGFGIRPSWDCTDAYDNGSNTAHARIWNSGKPIFNLKGVADLTNGNISTADAVPRFGGIINSTNNGNSNELVDVFAPVHSLRIGDMGNGRGVRYPTAFNENLLTELSAPNHKTGIVLSHNTAEPLFGDGLLRPRNDVLQADEVKRGISAKLGIDDNGLLKSEATVSDRVEEISGTTVHKDPVSRSSPRIGIDAEVVEGVEQSHIAINTEAHSLHTDRNVGQRVVLQGGIQIEGSLTDVDYTASNFSRYANGSMPSSVHRYSHTSSFRPYGGSYIIESKSHSGPFDDTGWGVNSLTGSNDTSNPYQDTTNHSTDTVRNNEDDTTVKFLLRPIRVLDANHVEVFRIHNSLSNTSPQHLQNYLHATSGGKYGLFTYETPNGRAPTANLSASRPVPDTNGPYLPVFVLDPTGTLETPSSHGPKLPGASVTGFSNSLDTTVSRVVMSENTLQHHRSDAPRRRQESDTDDEAKRPDFSVKPRFSQSLHGKGHKGDVTFSVTDHSGDGA